MDLKWIDTTSRRRGEIPAEPRTVSCRIGRYRISVTRKVFDPGVWYVQASDLSLERPLKAEDLEGAKMEALQVVLDEIRPLIDALYVIRSLE